MASKPITNKFTRLREKVERLKCDIVFLKKCKQRGVKPTFIKVKFAVTNNVTLKVKRIAENLWLKFELKSKYAALSTVELELYELHLRITKNLSLAEFNIWYEFLNDVTNKTSQQEKIEIQNRKLERLTLEKEKEQHTRASRGSIEDVVCNLSQNQFSEDEMMLLNKGLNFSIRPDHQAMVDVIVDIETVLKFKPAVVQNEIRSATRDILNELNSSNIRRHNNDSNFNKAIESLRSKDCVYVKADKGNKVVIMDKSDYDSRANKLITECNYKKLNKTPLNTMIKQANDIRKEISSCFGERFKWRLLSSNPQVPRIYFLPKIHKPGNKVRPIVSNLNAPTEKIAKWLVKEINSLSRIDSLSVKNSFEFIERIQNLTINEDEMMISFDVESLFPSIPVPDALEALNQHFIKQKVPPDKRGIYMKAARCCMAQNFFQFRNEFYKIEKGTSMGNSLSPVLAEAFMASFELQLRNENKLPRFWARYVDDVFAIVQRSQRMELLDLLNSRCNSIRFTHEDESDKRITFLDLMLQNINGKIDVSVHHKSTSTMRYIPNDSHAPIQHKQAAFHSLVHRLVKLPLSVANYKTEYERIKLIASLNGYNPTMIDVLIKTHARKVMRSGMTTLYTQNRYANNSIADPKRVCLSFVPEITNKLKNIFERNNMRIVYSSNWKLKNMLGSTKDHIKSLEKTGIYQITCGDCNLKYYGQTKRTISKRFKEHSGYIKTNQPGKSAIANHVLCNDHFNVSLDNVKLVKQVNDANKLDAYETFFIQRDVNALNLDNGNIQTDLFKLLF